MHEDVDGIKKNLRWYRIDENPKWEGDEKFSKRMALWEQIWADYITPTLTHRGSKEQESTKAEKVEL